MADTFLLDREGAQIFTDTSRRIIRQPRNLRQARPRNAPPKYPADGYLARVIGGEIPARYYGTDLGGDFDTVGAGTVQLYRTVDGEISDFLISKDAINLTGLAIADDSLVFVCREYGSHKFAIVENFDAYDRIVGTLTADFDDTDDSVAADNIQVIRGANPLDDPTSTTETVTLWNPTDFSGSDGNIVKAEWNPNELRFEIYDTPCQ